ncbi:hypothetical protein Bbelb_220110 [Branchiostoma belcheri]|nr:hypothetical protein Bbelb_220110 [Branchiostoma belcheri]
MSGEQQSQDESSNAGATPIQQSPTTWWRSIANTAANNPNPMYTPAAATSGAVTNKTPEIGLKAVHRMYTDFFLQLKDLLVLLGPLECGAPRGRLALQEKRDPLGQLAVQEKRDPLVQLALKEKRDPVGQLALCLPGLLDLLENRDPPGRLDLVGLRGPLVLLAKTEPRCVQKLPDHLSILKQQWGATCYKAFRFPANFGDSALHCRLDGGTLAMPRDAATNGFLINLKTNVDINSRFWTYLGNRPSLSPPLSNIIKGEKVTGSRYYVV